MTGAEKPRVTIVVSPRERFGVAKRSLESVYASTDIPFELVYIDGRSPARLSEWLKAEAAAKGFHVIHRDRYVTPNEARNLGLAASTTDYVVFVDNDVIYSEGWLGKLVECADETGADVVAPVTCEGFPVHSLVHQASGKFSDDRAAFFSKPFGERQFVEIQGFYGSPLKDVRDQLFREETDTCEFHCVLARRSVFDRIGPLDEGLYATREHFDFCMSVLQAGGKIMFEPASVVTAIFPGTEYPVTKDDLPYFLLRWSTVWQTRSLTHMRAKWGLKNVGDIYNVSQMNHLRYRHFQDFMDPLIKKIPVVRRSYRLSKMARKVLTSYIDYRVRELVAENDSQRASQARAAQ